MKRLIHQILTHHLLLERPPVLVDLGASGKIHSAWQQLAKYSICIAFDADNRDFTVSRKDDAGYKSLILINRVVTSSSTPESSFYLTQSPHCSSALRPDLDSLKSWAFYDLFSIRNEITLPSVTLNDSLANCRLDYIDWYKSDTQGTDLRIFDSLSPEIREQIITAEFEPGILDSYVNEDKLYALMAYMQQLPFWVSNMYVKGSQRVDATDLVFLNSFQQRFIKFFLRTSPGWCEIAYFNDFKDNFSERSLLLGWVIASIKNEHGFALQLARQGASRYDNYLFDSMLKKSLKNLNSPAGYSLFLFAALKKIFPKFLK